MSRGHIADGEGAPFVVLNIEPDFCEVEGKVVPFEIVQELAAEQALYAGSVKARSQKVLTVGSVIQAVQGDAGAGVISGTSQGGGVNVIIEGHPTINAEGKPVARHGHLVEMNKS